MKNALILLAGGSGKRFSRGNNSISKQFIKIGKFNIIEYFLQNLNPDIFQRIHIVVKKSEQKRYLKNIKKEFNQLNIHFVKAGKTRQESSKNGLNSFKNYNPKNIIIHDAARPLVSNKLIKKLIVTLKKCKSCSPYITNNDLIKYKKDKYKTLYSKDIMNIQTPQAFIYKSIMNAHHKTNIKNSRDDTAILQDFGIETKFVRGEKTNIKITYKEDIDLFNKIKKTNFRSGIGYDIHKIDFNSKKYLTLCGVKIKHPPLIGHSDADVGYHAICDSILGALSMRDIGYYFSNKNIKWKNANSKIFILFCKKNLEKKNYFITNLDINFICEKPNINQFVKQMKKNISNLLNLNQNIISIKATTNEKISLIGKGEGIAAESIVQIKNV